MLQLHRRTDTHKQVMPANSHASPPTHRLETHFTPSTQHDPQATSHQNRRFHKNKVVTPAVTHLSPTAPANRTPQSHTTAQTTVASVLATIGENELSFLNDDDNTLGSDGGINSLNFFSDSGNEDPNTLQQIQKMRRIGGLEPLLPGESVDISAALMGLKDLAGQKSQPRCQIEALVSIIDILKHHDTLHPLDAGNLLRFATGFINQIDPNDAGLEEMIKIAEVCEELATALIMNRSEINAVPWKLKKDLFNKLETLKNRNRHENPKLKYYLSSALEGFRALSDDRQTLLIILHGFFNLVMAALSLFSKNPDGATKRIEEAFEDPKSIEASPQLLAQSVMTLKAFPLLKLPKPKSWHMLSIMIKWISKCTNKHDIELAKSGEKRTLQMIDEYIDKYFTLFNWKFSYSAVLSLFDLCAKGKTQQIRDQAARKLGSFISCNALRRHLSTKPLLYLEKPKINDYNPRIRHIAAECLWKLFKDHDPILSDSVTAELLQKIQTQIQIETHKEAKGFFSQTAEIIQQTINRTKGYTQLMDFSIEKQDAEHAYETFKNMKAKEIQPSLAAFNGLLRLLLNSDGKTENAYDVFMSMFSGDFMIEQELYNSMLGSMVNGKDVKKICDLISIKSFSQRYILDANLCNSMIDLLVENNKDAAAHDLFTNKGALIRDLKYSQFNNLLVKKYDQELYDLALKNGEKAVYTAKDADAVYTLNALVKIFVNNNDPKAAAQIHSLMDEFHINLTDRKIHSSLALLLMGMDEIETANKILAKIKVSF